MYDFLLYKALAVMLPHMETKDDFVWLINKFLKIIVKGNNMV